MSTLIVEPLSGLAEPQPGLPVPSVPPEPPAPAPPADEPPPPEPPLDEPPSPEPPLDAPPADRPPVVVPPVAAPPPAAEPPVAAPPADRPPVVAPPVATPPEAKPPVAAPPVATPPVAKPPVATPPVATPPVAEPPAAAPPVLVVLAPSSELVPQPSHSGTDSVATSSQGRAAVLLDGCLVTLEQSEDNKHASLSTTLLSPRSSVSCTRTEQLGRVATASTLLPTERCGSRDGQSEVLPWDQHVDGRGAWGDRNVPRDQFGRAAPGRSSKRVISGRQLKRTRGTAPPSMPMPRFTYRCMDPWRCSPAA